ncbi:MAG: tetratricopeptide repeat protein [Verrucomicrobiae bacterium]|nr:tetratricopeptide repeat protein [Verrucomicrobiae bacterium]
MPEKDLTAIPRDVRVLIAKANDALARENFDYAMDLFCQVLSREPGLFECRRALRTAQRQKARGSFLKRALSHASVSPLLAKAQLALRKDPAAALAAAEEALNQDPDNSVAHRIVVEAARALEMPRTAALSLEILHQHAPRDKKLAIEFAQALAEAGEVRRGEQVLSELARSAPGDVELAQALKNLTARRTLGEGGYQKVAAGEGSYRDLLRNEQEAVALEQEQRVQKSEDVAARLIQEYERRLQTEPHNLKLVRSLAELYAEKKHFDRALELYERLRASEAGKDPSLERAIAQTIVRRYEHQIEQLNPAAADYAEQVARLQAEKLEFQLNECRQRAERYPTDLSIRFELGTLYFQAGRITEAIREFQKAQDNPHKRIAAMSYLAQCFARRKMFDLAAETLQNALKEKLVFDEEKKELLYQLGCALEQLGRKQEAIEQFKIIYKADIGYKDVAARVDAYYAEQEGGDAAPS